jgi:peptidoglycan DL-endopeptidase CwlO
MFLLRSKPPPRRQQSSWAGPVFAIIVAAVLVSATSHPAAHAKRGGRQHATEMSATGGGAPNVQTTAAVAWAKQQVGCWYVYGGTGPCSAGFDCSGLFYAAFAQEGVSIPRTTEAMWADLPHVSMSHLKPGDLILYTGSPIDPPPGHVVMWLGHGQILQAYATGYQVAISNGIPPGAWGAVRPD